MVFLLLFRAKCIPPFTQNLWHRPIILIGMPLMHQRSVPLGEDHKGIHRSTDVFFPIANLNINKKQYNVSFPATTIRCALGSAPFSVSSQHLSAGHWDFELFACRSQMFSSCSHSWAHQWRTHRRRLLPLRQTLLELKGKSSRWICSDRFSWTANSRHSIGGRFTFNWRCFLFLRTTQFFFGSWWWAVGLTFRFHFGHNIGRISGFLWCWTPCSWTGPRRAIRL